jgi:hypothetical protein
VSVSVVKEGRRRPTELQEGGRMVTQQNKSVNDYEDGAIRTRPHRQALPPLNALMQASSLAAVPAREHKCTPYFFGQPATAYRTSAKHASHVHAPLRKGRGRSAVDAYAA